ncbi:hypothetical protein [Streptomyces griseocarneus]|uniref:hypothetical protein n=1 Tax=Streptomyces griseocarneus TaxID=51201 RepID=UPI00167DB97E|nr:hypothetical protein [Streptomyces griseocarneus]MBZ6476426.1 hypothetical protein [Streptomyces griseocarneus]GHG78962.1 hypothetical protein GCM10018779_59420 [Streptomyces griseocarneus]
MTTDNRKAETAGYIRLIERSIDDGKFRDLLAEDPDSALKDIGLWVDDPEERALMAKRLKETIKAPERVGEEGAHVAVLVVVGVCIGTNLSVPEMADPVAYRQEIRNRAARAVEEQIEG